MRFFIFLFIVSTWQFPALAAKNQHAKNAANITALEEKIRKLNGQIEELTHNTSQLSTQLRQALEEINTRLLSLEQLKPPSKDFVQYDQEGKPATTSPIDVSKPYTITPQQNNDVSPKATTTPKDESFSDLSKEYENAFSLMRNAEYEKAEDAFYRFVQKYPDNDLTANAYYWLGETFYVRDLFAQSSVYFLKGYQHNATHKKASDSLFKLALSLKGLGKNAESCTTFDKLLKEFPKLSSTISEKVVIEKANLQCP